MKYTKKKVNANEIEFEIEISKDEWEHALEHAYEEKKSSYNIEGFRRGKAPRKVIEKIYGAGVFYDEAIGHSFSHAYQEILSKEKDFEPVDEPRLAVKSVGETCTLVATVYTMPEVKLGKYKGLNIACKEAKVTSAEVDAEIAKTLDEHARFVEVSDRAVQMGDTCNIDFKGSVDGKVFDGGTATGFDLEIGSHSFIDNFEDQLVGAKAGDNVDVFVTFPTNYGEKSLAGKKAKFEVKINSIKEKQVPALDEKFVSKVSECETVEDYKKEVREHLLDHAKEHARADLENEVIEKVVANAEVDILDVMVQHELDHMMQDLSYRLMYQGVSLEDYAKYVGTTVDEIRASRVEDAKRSVKISLVMQEIIKREKIDVTRAELNARFKDMAARENKSVDDYVKGLNPNQIGQVQNNILLNKLLAFLVENNEAKGAKPQEAKPAAKTTAKTAAKPATKATTAKPEAKAAAKKSAQKKTVKK